MSSGDKSVRFEAEDATCLRCDEKFVRRRAYVGGQPLPGAAAVCDECLEAERQEERKAQPWELHGKVSVEEVLVDAGVNTRKHGHSTLDGYDVSAGSTPVDAAREFVEDVLRAGRHDPVRSLYLTGPTGTGKTHLAVAAAREILERSPAPPSILFDRASRLITDIQDTYGSGKTGAVLERRERAGVWILDDIGTEKATPDVLRILFDLVNAREGHPTIMTSNLTPGDLGRRWPESDHWSRISSRLADQNFRVVGVKGRDRRFGAA